MNLYLKLPSQRPVNGKLSAYRVLRLGIAKLRTEFAVL